MGTRTARQLLPATAPPSFRPPALQLDARPQAADAADPDAHGRRVGGDPEEPGAQLERARAGGQQRAGRKARGPPRSAAHEPHAGRDLLALPHAREIDGVQPPHHGVEHEAHAPPRESRRVERERVPARRRAQIAERRAACRPAATAVTWMSGEPTGARAVISSTCWAAPTASGGVSSVVLSRSAA